MNHADHVSLIRAAVDRGTGRRWLELGAGDGAFTLALADLLGAGGDIVAIDRDVRAMGRLPSAVRERFPDVTIATRVADFTAPLAFADATFDGILAANSLHFVADRRAVLADVRRVLVREGRLVVVEYDADRGNPWVPHPFSYATWVGEAAGAHFGATRRIGAVPSRFLGAIYGAVTFMPAKPAPGRGAG